MRHVSLTLCVAAILIATGCSHKEQPAEGGGAATSTAAPSAAAEQASTSAPTGGKLTMGLTFDDVAVTTSGAPVLRLGFTAKNNGPDPVLCEEGSFSLQLTNGSSLDPDAGAENRCDPDTIDPGTSGKGTMFFDIPNGYSGPVTLVMTDNGNVIGRGTTNVQ